MRQTIEQAILGKTPDVTAVEVEDTVDTAAAGPVRVALTLLSNDGSSHRTAVVRNEGTAGP